MFVGTLVTSTSNAPKLAGTGATMVMLELGWTNFETADGVNSATYITSVKAQIAAFKAAGMNITLSLGIHYTPSWILAKPASQWTDQAANTSALFNMVFSQSMRDYVARYIANVHAAFDLNTFAFIRLNSAGSPAGELMYPTTTGWWAYSTGAQNGADAPTSLPANPMPGYIPGDTVTDTQRQTWLDWYVGALANIVDWQITQLAALGYKGRYQTVCPGQGIRVSIYNTILAENYAVTGSTLGLIRRGTAWANIHAQISSTNRPRIFLHCSSVADGSGSPADNVTQAGDPGTAIASASTNWSAVRWQARIVSEYGLAGITGENPGFPNDHGTGDAHYTDLTSAGLLAVTLTQAQSCGLAGIYWAHDDHVASGVIPLARLTAADTDPKTNRFTAAAGGRVRRIA